MFDTNLGAKEAPLGAALGAVDAIDMLPFGARGLRAVVSAAELRLPDLAGSGNRRVHQLARH